jgi:hypothetical protein
VTACYVVKQVAEDRERMQQQGQAEIQNNRTAKLQLFDHQSVSQMSHVQQWPVSDMLESAESVTVPGLGLRCTCDVSACSSCWMDIRPQWNVQLAV